MNFFPVNFLLVNYYLVTFGIVTDRQTDGQTDRRTDGKRRIRAHRASGLSISFTVGGSAKCSRR